MFDNITGFIELSLITKCFKDVKYSKHLSTLGSDLTWFGIFGRVRYCNDVNLEMALNIFEKWAFIIGVGRWEVLNINLFKFGPIQLKILWSKSTSVMVRFFTTIVKFFYSASVLSSHFLSYSNLLVSFTANWIIHTQDTIRLNIK